MWKDFRSFLLKQNVVALAVAVVIGGALGKLVSAFVADFIMPIVGALTPSGDWRTTTWDAGPMKFGIGDFIGATLDFLIIGFVAWRMTRLLVPKEAPARATKVCPACRQEVDALASRCQYCTSPL